MTAQWEHLPNGLQRRVYPSYAAYVAHQGVKLGRMAPAGLQAHDRRFSAALRLRVPRPTADASVLCLGARTGAEVQVFQALGYRAIGVDVQPGAADVVPGDFHALPFRDASFSLVFTNALDHAYDLALVLAECRRVLTARGVLWLEVVRGTAEGCAVGSYESLVWPTIDVLLPIIDASGFRCDQRVSFDCPWPGEALVCHR